jgi:hypothetical protein
MLHEILVTQWAHRALYNPVEGDIYFIYKRICEEWFLFRQYRIFIQLFV